MGEVESGGRIWFHGTVMSIVVKCTHVYEKGHNKNMCPRFSQFFNHLGFFLRSEHIHILILSQ